MKTENLEVMANWMGTHWAISEPGTTEVSLRVEALVMRATRSGKGFAQGYIVAIHGLDQEIASRLDNAQLKMLGVGAQFRSQAAPPRWAKTKRVNLTTAGAVIGTF